MSTPPVASKRGFFSRASSRAATPQPDQSAQLSKQLDQTSLDDAGDADEAAPLELDDAAADLQAADVDSEQGESPLHAQYSLIAQSALPASLRGPPVPCARWTRATRQPH